MHSFIPEGIKCFEVMEIIDFARDKAAVKFCDYWEEPYEGRCKCNFLGIECDDDDEKCELSERRKECNINRYNHVKMNEFYFKFD
jgi:hypothetical protein